MQLKAEVTILGMRKAKGTYEGVDFDSTKIFVEDSLGNDDPNTRGTATVTYKVGTSAEFGKYENLPFPMRAEIAFESVADGKGGSRNVIKDIRPIVTRPSAAAPK